MSKPMKVVCNNCGREFRSKIRRRMVNASPYVEERFLFCPKCGARFHIGMYDQILEDMIANHIDPNRLVLYQKGLENKYGKEMNHENH